MFFSIKFFDSTFNDYLLILCYTMWHIFVYILNKIFDINEDTVLKKNPIFESEKKAFIIISVLLVLIPFIILIINKYDLIPFVILVFVGFIYSSSPFGKEYRVKNVLILKNIYAAFWTIAVPCLIAIVYQKLEMNSIMMHYFSYYFLLLLSIEIISDLPDTYGDKQMGVVTIPVKWGFTVTKFLSLLIVGALVIYSIVVTKYLLGIIPFYIFLGLLISNENSIKKNIAFIFHGYLILILIFSMLGWAF